MNKGSRQDAELGTILRRNDPAGIVDPMDSTRLEMFIVNRLFHQPQISVPRMTDFFVVPRMTDFFVVPHLLRGALPWPLTLTGVMALGLVLGFFVASISDTTPAASYNIAMNGPWQHLMR